MRPQPGATAVGFLAVLVAISVLPFAFALLGAASPWSFMALAREGGSDLEQPVVFSPGTDHDDSAFVTAWRPASDGAGFDVALRGVPAATLRVGDLARIENRDRLTHDVFLSAPPVPDARVDVYRFTILDGSTVIGVLDLKSEHPSLHVPAMPPGASYALGVELMLAEGAEGTLPPSPIRMTVRG